MLAQTPIAVVGIGCRFASCDGADAFWRTLVQARSCVGGIPAQRWDARRFAGDAPAMPGRSYSLHAGMDDQGDCYDADFFQIDAGERERMDPQQGLALELAWHACEDAGIAPDRLSGEPVGVFVGVSTRDFDRRMANGWDRIDMRTSTGASAAIVANRISYLLGLTGPSVAVDGACASSLMSLHMACRALADGECSLALAGGVQLILSPANMIAFSQAGALARDGRCKPFSAQADGYVCGEGGGLVLLKPLQRALEDGDRIRAVVRGSAINHNGRSNGLSAPYRQAQRQVMGAALVRAQLDPASVDYVEAHAVGTLLGDAIEMQAIRDVYDQARADGQECFVGSVKSNIGHLEAAAGIASFIKAALMVEQGVLPPTLHAETPSKLLRLDQGRLRVCDALRPWSCADAPRRAGVSAFSFGGSNAHVIVEQAPSSVAVPTQAIGPWLLAVSAPDALGLQRLRDAYAQFALDCRERNEPVSVLRDLCASTLAHRRVFALRRGWLVSDWDEAIAALQAPEAATDAQPQGEWRIAPLRSVATGASPWPTWDESLSHYPSAQHALLWPILWLFHLGVTRLVVDGDSAQAHAAAQFATALGLSVTRYGDAPVRAGVPILDAGAFDADAREFAGDESAAQATAADSLQEHLGGLCADLLRRGVAVRWSAYAESIGARYRPLPLYPFERRRHHVMLDELDPAVAGVQRARAQTQEACSA